MCVHAGGCGVCVHVSVCACGMCGLGVSVSVLGLDVGCGWACG